MKPYSKPRKKWFKGLRSINKNSYISTSRSLPRLVKILNSLNSGIGWQTIFVLRLLYVMARPIINPKTRFHGMYKINEHTGCWEWDRALKKGGYGRFMLKVNGVKLADTAHRSSYIIHKGDIPDGVLVCHHCDNRKCCNPEHLFLGTHKDNMKDALDKGRIKASSCPSNWNYQKGCRCEPCVILKRKRSNESAKKYPEKIIEKNRLLREKRKLQKTLKE